MAQAGKRADKATTEGLVGVIVSDGAGTIAGIGCETEPVSKNESFRAYAERAPASRACRWPGRRLPRSTKSGSS